MGIVTRTWQSERFSRVRPCFSGPKTSATRPPRSPSQCSIPCDHWRRSGRGSRTTGCSALRWVNAFQCPRRACNPPRLPPEMAHSLAVSEQLRCADGRLCLAPVLRKRRDDGQSPEPEVGHGARHGANVQRVARRDENDIDARALSVGQQTNHCRAAFACRSPDSP